METRLRRLITLSIVLSAPFIAGCGCGAGPGPWGSPPPAYPSGYGAASPPGGVMTTAPPNNLAPAAAPDAGWRPAQ